MVLSIEWQDALFITKTTFQALSFFKTNFNVLLKFFKTIKYYNLLRFKVLKESSKKTTTFKIVVSYNYSYIDFIKFKYNLIRKSNNLIQKI